MSAKRLAGLSLVWLLPLSALAQYTTTYTRGVTDFTPYAATTNLWLQLPGNGQCIVNSASVGYDGSVWCKGTDGYVYEWTVSTLKWAKKTAMGTSVASLAVRSAGTVWALIPNSYCQSLTPASFGVYKWISGAWTQPNANACLNQMNIADDGFLSGIQLKPNPSTSSPVNPAFVVPPSTNELHYSRDNGVSWSMWETNWNFVHMASANTGCAITGQGYIYQISFHKNSSGALDVAPVAINPLPTPSNPIEPTFMQCAYSQQDPLVMAIQNNGTVWLQANDGSGKWTIIPGSVSQIMTITQASTFALDSAGYVYHWNIYPQITIGRTTGTYPTGCGAPGNGCPATFNGGPLLHTINLRVHYPHSIGSTTNAGQMQTQQINPSASADLTAWDANPLCDPLFGDPSSAECLASAEGPDTCPIAGVIGTPPPPETPVNSWEFLKRGTGPVYYAPPYISGGQYVCESNWPVAPNCQPPTTVSYCKVSSLTDRVKVTIGTNPPSIALLACEADSIAAPNQGPWLAMMAWYPPIGSASCFKIRVMEHTPGGPCF